MQIIIKSNKNFMPMVWDFTEGIPDYNNYQSISLTSDRLQKGEIPFLWNFNLKNNKIYKIKTRIWRSIFMYFMIIIDGKKHIGSLEEIRNLLEKRLKKTKNI